eukprot:7858826-Karenia_brevis.AAC.1
MEVVEISSGEGGVSKMSLRRHLTKGLKNQPGQFWPKSTKLSLVGSNSDRRQFNSDRRHRMNPCGPVHQRLMKRCGATHRPLFDIMTPPCTAWQQSRWISIETSDLCA